MQKELEINIFDEIGEDTVLEATAILDLETGAVSKVVYDIPQPVPPCQNPDYSFSYGLLKLQSKELEFTLQAEKNGTYRVPAGEFLEMKEKAVQLLSKSKLKP